MNRPTPRLEKGQTSCSQNRSTASLTQDRPHHQGKSGGRVRGEKAADHHDGAAGSEGAKYGARGGGDTFVEREDGAVG